MHPGRLNRGQRIVIVVGLGVVLYFFGAWVTTRGTGATGWVGYAPLTNPYTTPNAFGGLHTWVRLVIWLFLALVWVVASVVLLRTPPTPNDSADTEASS